MTRFLLVLAATLTVPGVLADAAPAALGHPTLPAHAHLVYDTTGNVRLGGFSVPILLHGTTRTDWHFDAGRFDAQLENALAEFSQTTSGRVRPEAGLAFERYTEKRHHRAEIAARIDWGARQIRFTQAPDVLSPPDGIQDRLSVQFQMAVLRQAFPDRFAPGAKFSVPVAGTHDFTDWQVSVCCEESVATAQGTLPALRIHSSRADGATREALDMWLSAKIGWFPVRVRLIDRDGNVIDSVLQSAALD